MTQRVESARFPYVPVRVVLGGRTLVLDALLDTGFDGELAIPSVLDVSERPAEIYQQWVLADGAIREAPVYEGVVQVGDFDPVPARIAVIGSEIVVGRSITDRYSVTLEHGRRVIVEP